MAHKMSKLSLNYILYSTGLQAWIKEKFGIVRDWGTIEVKVPVKYLNCQAKKKDKSMWQPWYLAIFFE